MGNERDLLTQETATLFKKAGFETSLCNIRSCYDLIARGKTTVFLIKVSPNVDTMSSEYVQDLKSLCYYFKAHPLIVSLRTKNEHIRRGVIHSREDIPVLSVETLEDIMINNEPPLVYADRGGLYVHVQGEILKKLRENMGYSLAEFAKEIGISRSTLYDYEHSSRGIDVSIALKLEEMLETPIIKPLSIRTEVERDDRPQRPVPRSPLEKDVYEMFDHIGLAVHPTKRTPFDAVVKEPEHAPRLFMLTGISDMDLRSVKRRIHVVHELATLLEKDAIFVFNSPVLKRTIQGVPIIQLDEMRKVTDTDSMLEVVQERKDEGEEED
jgi:putative transcriptional regulator